MEKFYLEKPSLKRKQDIIEFFNEFKLYNLDINGSGSLARILTGTSFEDALENCLNTENEAYARSVDRCPGKTFLLIRQNDNKIVGTINIRWNLTEKMKQFNGNIGYEIRPLERRKGYNKINLYLGLLEAKKLGLESVILSCDSKNIGSYKTMESLGGKKIKEEIDPDDGILTKVYSFDVKKCIDIYKNIYNKYIDNINE